MSTNYATHQDKVVRLFKLGHFYSPTVMRLWPSLPVNDTERLTLLKNMPANSPIFEAARLSFQEMMRPQFEALCLEEHNRLPVWDGLQGPAEDALYDIDRCGHPDWRAEGVHNPNADKAGKTAAATGSGSWPHSCYEGYEGVHRITYRIDYANAPSAVMAVMPEVIDASLRNYREMGCLMEEASNGSIDVYWTSLPGSTIGLAQFPNGTCNGGYPFCELDQTYAPQDTFNQIALLLSHEWGHNHNIDHISGCPIMHPSVLNIAYPTSFRGLPIGGVLTRYYGGEPVGEPEQPPTEPPTEPPVEPPVEPVPPSPVNIELHVRDTYLEVVATGPGTRRYSASPMPTTVEAEPIFKA